MSFVACPTTAFCCFFSAIIHFRLIGKKDVRKRKRGGEIREGWGKKKGGRVDKYRQEETKKEHGRLLRLGQRTNHFKNELWEQEKKHRRYRKGPIFCKYTWQYKKDDRNSFLLSCIPVTYACLSFFKSWNDLCLCGIFINIFQLLEPAKARKQRERWEEKSGERKGRKIKGEKKEKKWESTGENKRIQERKEKSEKKIRVDNCYE